MNYYYVQICGIYPIAAENKEEAIKNAIDLLVRSEDISIYEFTEEEYKQELLNP